MCVSNPWNEDFDDLYFYGDQMLITEQWMYHVNDYIVERFNNGSNFDVSTNLM